MSDKVIMVYTVNDSSAFVFNQTLDNMKVIGKWQDNPDQLFKLGATVFNLSLIHISGIILPSGVKSNLCTQSVPILGKQLAGMKVQIKETKE